ncbi:MAG: glycosyltransferase [Acidimicrobiales bacterium]|nr:glycosyltransferase [Acidimicrobiales bacterium]
MQTRHALVVHTRMPAFDRDSGSQDIDNTVRWLVEQGWQVTFLCRETEAEAEDRHANRLRQMGVAAFAGLDWLPKLLRSYEFDLAIVAFWEVAAAVTPVIHEYSPSTRVVVNSMDIHFLRHARQAFGEDGAVDEKFGKAATDELNVYHAADAVIAVSDKERALLGDFVGDDRVHTLPLAERIARSTVSLADRVGMYFVGNFRHVPNRDAVAYLANEVLPLVDPALLERHPFTVIGNYLDQITLDVDPDMPGLNLVGWVPSVQPYVERSRVTVVPLLHGAGVKRKVIQSMMAYTPVVTTPVGAEGLDLVQGRHALIAADAADMAAALTRVLTDDDLWLGLADAGAAHVDGRHGLEAIGCTFEALVDEVMRAPLRPRARGVDGIDADVPNADAASIRERIQAIAEPGAAVLVVTQGDDSLADIGSHPCWHFPEARDGGWAGFDPVNGRAAVNHLDAQMQRGARYFVVPRAAFGWRQRFPELFAFLDDEGRRLYQDGTVAIYDLLGGADTTLDLPDVAATSVFVAGTFSADRSGPPPDLTAELQASNANVRQIWRADDDPDATAEVDDSGADVVLYIHDNAVLPSGFVDDVVRLQAALDADRLQPSHNSGPLAGPPMTERHRGVVARLVDEVTPLPVLAVRAGAAPTGPTVLADAVPIGLRATIECTDLGDSFAHVRRVWTSDDEGRLVVNERPEPASPPEISVLISTYNRPELLRAAVESFCDQTIDPSRYEVVLVDDGSAESAVHDVVGEFADRIQIVGVCAGHAGRSAAKNLCVLLARSPIVLFFDDDDRVAPDCLERHLAGHEERPDEGVAILGHTAWAPELEITPLMHFITDVDRLMFSYGSLHAGQQLDWRGFWEGRISCKRSLLMRHGLHDQRLNYSIDIEMAWRLMPHGLTVVYDPTAVSVMARPLDFDGFCDRTQAKGKAMAVIASLHPGTDIGAQLKLDESTALYEESRFAEEELRTRVAQLEIQSATDESVLPELHDCYRSTFRILNAKGVAETTGKVYAMPRQPTTVQPFEDTDPDLLYDASPPEASDEPLLSITLPVWSRSEKLARMVEKTVDRIWEVSRIPTEVVAIDNGSDFESELKAKVYRYPENKGVSTGWNTGIRLSTAATFVVMNSDCMVEPGWDEALYEAANDGRRIAFPYTDHCDGQGFTTPDQGGTAGWCFMMTKAIYEEVGVFDEWFNPAFCEDTDYWHRAWQLGIDLEPVPAAHVVHARRTTASTTPHVDWLLLGHRYKYGWKHGVDPLAAPPYYNRKYEDYVGSFEVPS